MAKQAISKDYKLFLAEIKKKVYRSQYETMRLVNKSLIGLYWDIGKNIVVKQQKHKWGKSIVEKLANDLQHEFSGMQGWSSHNLWRMRKFYLLYKTNQKLAPLVQEISWSHNIIIMEKCKDKLEREFYIKMAIKYGWTKNILIHHVEGKSYERFLLGQTNFDKALPEKYKYQAKLAVKDEYNFDFLEIAEEHEEKELETAIMKNMRRFLMEMGGDFTFVGNQFRLQSGEEFYYIDLLLYHRKLKSLIAIELKAGKFKPSYAGQMNFYLAVLNDQIKTEEENPSIGIIVCKAKDRTTVDYALKETNNPIGVASYKVTPSLPKNMKKYLPSPTEIVTSMAGIIDIVK